MSTQGLSSSVRAWQSSRTKKKREIRRDRCHEANGQRGRAVVTLQPQPAMCRPGTPSARTLKGSAGVSSDEAKRRSSEEGNPQKVQQQILWLCAWIEQETSKSLVTLTSYPLTLAMSTLGVECPAPTEPFRYALCLALLCF